MRAFNKSLVLVPLVALAAILIGLPTVAFGRDGGKTFSTRLNGYNETPASINTPGTGTLTLTVSDDDTRIHFVLNYQDVTSAPTQAHIHFGQSRTSGGVVLFFCGAVPPAHQACPSSGTVEGDLTAADVIPQSKQGINVGDFAAVLRAIRAGAAYGNLHTSNFPGGEIRGQIHRSAGDRDDSDTDR